MGVHRNIGYGKFPKQGGRLGQMVNVCFNYNTTDTMKGKIIRDDIEEPFRTIIQLEDNRIVDATECQYSFS